MNNTLAIVDREKFSLRVYKWREDTNRWRRNVTFRVTVGAIGHATPAGPYRVVAKSRTPSWQVPSDPSYFEEEWGRIYKFEDPRNPFAGGFISLGGHPSTNGDGVGFHGTKFPPKVGTRSSHGCVRLELYDLLKLYDRLPIGTNVWIA